MELQQAVSRRRWLTTMGATLGATALAACGAETTTTQTAAPTTGAGTTPGAGTTAQAIPGAGIVKGPLAGEAQALTGAGATFPAVLYSKWFDEYNRLTKVQINYQSIGSGGGIKATQDQTVDFGASDGPMTDDQLKEAKGGEILHVPMTLGATVVTYNVPEVPASTKLKFTGETIAGIFLGTITKWSDAKLKADNPGVPLPDKDIVTVHRSDGSGTTFNFTDYLSNVSADWSRNVASRSTACRVLTLPTLGGQGVVEV